MKKSVFTVIDNTEESKDKFGHNYGSQTFNLTSQDIRDLIHRGKCLASDFNGGEYTLFITFG